MLEVRRVDDHHNSERKVDDKLARITQNNPCPRVHKNSKLQALTYFSLCCSDTHKNVKQIRHYNILF